MEKLIIEIWKKGIEIWKETDKRSREYTIRYKQEMEERNRQLEEEKEKKTEFYRMEQNLKETWLSLINIFPGTIEQYSDLYFPVEIIPLGESSPNKGIGITKEDLGKTYDIISDVKIDELQKLGLVAIVEAQRLEQRYGAGITSVCYYGLPVREIMNETHG